MKPDALSQLIAYGDEYESLLEQLEKSTEKTSDQWVKFSANLHTWLTECVSFGKYLPPASGDRRVLQGQVNFWTSKLLQLGKPLSGIDRLELFDPNAGHPLPDNQFPYYGLVAATKREDFWGRDEEIKDYTKKLDEKGTLLIISESGGGKSSIALAGIIPELQKKYAEKIKVKKILPGAKPYDTLCAALAIEPEQDITISCELILKTYESHTLLIFVDQLEELLTVCTDKFQQENFCNLLIKLIESKRIKLLATIRVDHQDRLANTEVSKPLRNVFCGSEEMLPAMTFEQIRIVILKPAQKIGLRFTPDSLIDKLANETANLPGGLPRLQFALKRLWALRPKGADGVPLDIINQEIFDELPSVNDALGKIAQGVYNPLNDNEKKACERLMLELAVLDDHLETPLRRRRLEKDIHDVLKGAKLTDNPEELIEKFAGEGLLVRSRSTESQNSQDQVVQIEVAHESLFRYWREFNKWINNDIARIRLKEVRDISKDALLWKDKNKSPDYLKLKGEPLKRALSYRDENWLDSISSEYCDACNKAENTQQEELNKINKIKGIVNYVWLIIVIFVPFFLYFNSQVYLTKIKDNANQAAAASLKITPIEELDLAHTLSQANNSSIEYRRTLARAWDRLHGSYVVGDRRLDAYFSRSGRALYQLKRHNKQSLEAYIYPIDNDGNTWSKPVIIEVPDTLASIDVSPPKKGSQFENDSRVVAMLYRTPSKDVFEKIMTYTIKKDKTASETMGNYKFPSNTKLVSDIDFNNEAITVATVQFSEHGPSDGEVISINAGKVNNPTQLKGTLKDNFQDIITAIAYTGKYEISGRLNGTIFCGKNIRKADSNGSPIRSLQISGQDSLWYAALNYSNQIIVGKCGDGKTKIINLDPSWPASIFLNTVDNGKTMQLSYGLNRTLCQITWAYSDKEMPDHEQLSSGSLPGRKCISGSSIAIPIFSQAPANFLAMPVEKTPWLIKNNTTSAGNGSEFSGMPVSYAPLLEDDPSIPAVSPNKKYLARINNIGIAETKLNNEWSSATIMSDQTSSRLASITINDDGLLAAISGDTLTLRYLGSDDQAKIKKSITISNSELHLDKIKCVNFSQNGQQLIVADEKGKLVRYEVNKDKPIIEFPLIKKDDEHKGKALTACAVSNNGKVVLSFNDGLTKAYPPSSNKPIILGEYAPFRLDAIQDVSINDTGRYVAVLGERNDKACIMGTIGYPVRIWDLNSLEKDKKPISSGCLPGSGSEIKKIGPLTISGTNKTDWAFSAYFTAKENNDGVKVKTIDYTCLACDETDIGIKRLEEKIKEFSPNILSKDSLKRRYDIDL